MTGEPVPYTAVKAVGIPAMPRSIVKPASSNIVASNAEDCSS